MHLASSPFRAQVLLSRLVFGTPFRFAFQAVENLKETKHIHPNMKAVVYLLEF
jgi:hypothetical protein